jgi:hypothetical protein
MKLLKVYLCLALVCLGVSACTSVTALEPQSVARDNSSARIYFIRPSTLMGAGQPVGVTVNDKMVGSLGIGTYMHIDRPAGEYRVLAELAFDVSRTELTVNVAAQKDYYFKLSPALSHIAAVGYAASVSKKLGIAAISEAEAKALMREMTQ